MSIHLKSDRYPKILYWKWDEKTPDYLEHGLYDSMSRFDYDLLYVSFHHLSLPFCNDYLQTLIRKTVDILAAQGKKLLLDIDARNEFDAFSQLYPDDIGLNIRFWEFKLDKNGCVSFTKENHTAGRTGRTRVTEPPLYIAGMWLMKKSGVNEYAPASLSRLSGDVITIENNGDTSFYTIDAGLDVADYTILIAPVFRHGIPDLFSANLDPFYSTLFDAVADLPLGGVANDEWGWDLVLQNDDGLFYIDAFPYSQGFERKYHELTGRLFSDDMIDFVYHPAGDISQSVLVTDSYISTLRKRMEENNQWLYNETKRHFGDDAFVGVHPTFWGDYSDFQIDIAHNGISWWEVPRDFAQTDEFVAMPIRTALAHKWGGPVFYNMWYSGNSQQLDSYWRETWNNVRFGGRTHYLGYECPHEPGVFRLKHPGALEGVEQMERKVTKIDALQKSQPDCRVAVVFGMEALSCPVETVKNMKLSLSRVASSPGHAKIVRGQGPLPDAVKFVSALFEACLCDFIPSTEIANGSLNLTDGEAVYGSQKYDIILFIYPEYMDRLVLDRLKTYVKLGGTLIVSGPCNYFNDGTSAADEFSALTHIVTNYRKEMLSPGEALRLIDKHNIPRNRFENGCIYQDGSALFTADAVAPTGNILEVNVIHNGRRVDFIGEDYLYISADGRKISK